MKAFDGFGEQMCRSNLQAAPDCDLEASVLGVLNLVLLQSVLTVDGL